MPDCRSGTLKCKLGALGCAKIQLSGNTAANIKRSFDSGYKDCIDPPPLGPGQYDLMVIGDFPSLTDDSRDIPFQDNPSGLILDYLEKAGHDLDRVYMTKLVKCAPPRKRKPAISEYNTCRDAYLKPELDLIQPKVVLLVGAPSLKAFNLTGIGSINSIRGRVFDSSMITGYDGPGFHIVPTLNPASFFFRPNDKLKARVGHDYVVAKQLIDNVPVTDYFKPEYELIDSVDKLNSLVERVESAAMIAFDTESAALNPRKTPLLSVQISWDWDKTAVIPIHQHDPNCPKDQEFHVKDGFGKLHHKETKAALKKIFENSSTVKAAHNIKYDINVLRCHYGLEVKGFLLDVWVEKHLMDENPPSDLEFCCDLEFAWGDYSQERRKITGSGKKLKNTFDKVPDDILWQYGATDALGTYRLASVYTQRLKTNHPNLWTFYCEESEPLIRPLAKAEFKGSLTDTQVMDALEEEWQDELDQLLVTMRGYTHPDFNPGSNPQVFLAFNNLGVSIELIDETAASGYRANKKKLQELQETSSNQKVINMSRDILQYRNRRKMLSTYMRNARLDMDSDGRLRYSWVQAGPVTGRLSCRFFHQIPKVDEARFKSGKPIMRDMFIAPKGYKYVYGDYSQVELRILALLANDIEMIYILDNEGDLHAVTTFEFLKGVWPGYTELMAASDKFNRTEVGKRVNFGLAYGSEGFALVKTGKWKDATGVERQFTWDMLNSGMRRWKNRFTGVSQFIEDTPDFVRMNNNTAVNVFGRERHLGAQLTHFNDYERGRAEREAINFFIQSAAASITNRTIIEIDKLLVKFGVSEQDICLINTVHDSLAYEVADHLVEWFTNLFKIVATRAIAELMNKSFKLDVGVGQNWSQAEMAA